MSARPLTPRERMVHRALVALFLAAALVVARLIVINALDKGIHVGDRIGLIVMGLAVLVMLWRINPDFKGLLSGKLSVVKDRKASENAFTLLLTLLSLIASAIGLMAPRPAIESQPGVIEAMVRSISGETRHIDVTTTETKQDTQAIKDALGIDQGALIGKITGTVWGEEPDCTVTYRYEFRNNALIIDSPQSVRGTDVYHWEGAIDGIHGSTVLTTTLGNGPNKGIAVSFTYALKGTGETLTRADRSRPNPLEFRRCG